MNGEKILERKNKLKKFILFVLLFVLFILLFYINKVEAANDYDYIIVGDSRTVGLYNSVTNSSQQTQSVTTATVNNKTVRFLGVGSIGFDYWFKNNTNYAKITNALANGKTGAKCFIWLGINGNISDSYAQKYADELEKLAKNYPNVNIYFCSVTGIYENEYKKYYAPMTNTKITNFNQKVKSLLSSKSRYNKNLGFIDVSNKNVTINSQTKTVNNWVINSKTYAPDGLHYTAPLYTAIWNQAMVRSTTSGNSSSTSNTSTGTSHSGPSMSTNTITAAGETRNTTLFNDVLDDAEYYSNVGSLSKNDENRIETIVSKILSIITNIGIVISLLMLAILGVKYMIGNTIEVKKEIIPYIVGAFLIFSISIVIKILQSLGNSIN